MTAFLIILYALVLPYLGLMLLIIAGMVRRRPPAATPEPAPPRSISVVLPARNEEERLPVALASLARQRYRGQVEFLVVDDRSSDGTAEVIKRFAARDRRFRYCRVERADGRLAPKVNAVNAGIRAARHEIIVTTDADCRHPAGWLEELAARFTPGVVMVAGYVETRTDRRPPRGVQAFEAVDWFSLMLVSRSLVAWGWMFASSANNQAYLRSAFEAAGGFGAAGRAPSGDEDLLAQRLGRLPAARMAFTAEPAARVLTDPMPGLWALLRQRRRWVSRYHHLIHYPPSFLLPVALLGLQSTALTLALLSLPLAAALAPWVLGLWAAKLAIEVFGIRLGARQLGRPDLAGWAAVQWAVFHPPFIAAAVAWSLLSPGEWRAGAAPYRRRLLRRRAREWRRRLRARLLR